MKVKIENIPGPEEAVIFRWIVELFRFIRKSV